MARPGDTAATRWSGCCTYRVTVAPFPPPRARGTVGAPQGGCGDKVLGQAGLSPVPLAGGDWEGSVKRGAGAAVAFLGDAVPI